MVETTETTEGSSLKATTEGATEVFAQEATQSQSGTQKITQTTTEKATEKATEKSEKKTTEKSNKNTTKATTEKATEKTTEKSSSTCNHDWQYYDKTYKYVAEKGHYEEVLVKDAYKEPVKERHAICNYCGLDCTAAGVDAGYHTTYCGPIGEINGTTGHVGCAYTTRSVIVDYINHDAEYETQWVVDDAVTEILKCSKCGKTKNGQQYDEYNY